LNGRKTTNLMPEAKFAKEILQGKTGSTENRQKGGDINAEQIDCGHNHRHHHDLIENIPKKPNASDLDITRACMALTKKP